MYLVGGDDDERRLGVDDHHPGVNAVELPERDACHGYERSGPRGEQGARSPKYHPANVAGEVVLTSGA